MSMGLSLPSNAKIAIVVPRRIGDVLLSTPFVYNLKQVYPDSEITVFVKEGTQIALDGNALVSNVVVIPRGRGIRRVFGFIARHARKYDAVFSLLPSDRAFIVSIVLSRTRVGFFSEGYLGRLRKLFLASGCAYKPDNKHTISSYCDLLMSIGVPVSSLSVVPGHCALDMTQFDLHDEYVVLHPYPKFTYKMWNKRDWIALAIRIQESGYRVVITGSARGDEQQYCADIARGSGAISLAGKLRFSELTCVLEKASAYVGVDTSVSHLAAATGTNSLILFGPTSHVKWGPMPAACEYPDCYPSPYPPHAEEKIRKGNVTILRVDPQSGFACMPCDEEGCFRSRESPSLCLESLEVEAVFKELSAIL